MLPLSDLELQILSLAANATYMNLIPIGYEPISDEIYDDLAARYEATTSKSVKSLVQWDPDLRVEHFNDCQPLSKWIVDNSNMVKSITDHVHNYPSSIITFKYDGSSIKIYYDEDGNLKKVIGTPDETFGFDRTRAFFDLVPKKVRRGIKSLRGEVLVDAGKYGQSARNKANGITNSKWMDAEVNSEAFIRVYEVTYYNPYEKTFDTMIQDLCELPIIRKIRNGVSIPVFKSAEILELKEVENKLIFKRNDGTTILADGYVIYSESGAQGFKYYYTESAVTKVNYITWNYNSDNSSHSAVLNIEPIVLNEKTISNISANGAPTLISTGAGVGASINVILANLTIPKVHEVLIPSKEFKFPTCKCGTKLSENDIYGAALKCPNQKCTQRVTDYSNKIQWFIDNLGINNKGNFESTIIETPKFIFDIMRIDRFNPYIKDQDEFSKGIITSLKEENFELFKKTTDQVVNGTNLINKLYNLYVYPTFKALLDKYKSLNEYKSL